MTRPEILGWGLWAQQRLGAHLLTVDHPGLPECAGWHKPDLPCDGQRGKHPACSWARDSTNDAARLRALIGGRLRNLAIDTRKSGFLVVDEDRHGVFTAWAASTGHAVPQTFTVATAKGRHYYFRQPPGHHLGNATGRLPGDIDIRGSGYVLAPGSLHETGVVYTPDDHTVPVATIPDWLVTALRSPASGAAGQPFSRPRQRGSLPGRLRGILAVVLDATAPAGDRKGNRNERLFWAACTARKMIAAGELDQATAIRVLTEAGEATGLGSGAVRATIASGMREVGA